MISPFPRVSSPPSWCLEFSTTKDTKEHQALWSHRIKLLSLDHCLTNPSCFAKSIGRAQISSRICQELLQLLVEDFADQLRRMHDHLARIVRHIPVVPHALRNHQPVNAVSGEILHVAVKKTRSLTVKHSVAITTQCSYRRRRAR